MRLSTLLGASFASMLVFSQAATADEVSRIACMPVAGVSEEPYFVDCESQPDVECTCREGFTAIDPSMDDGAGRAQPVSASPG